MPGLNLKMGVGGGASTGSSASQPAPTTAGQAAFGDQYTPAGGGSGGGLLSALTPNDAFGIAHWSGLIATAGLVFLWWSLPA